MLSVCLTAHFSILTVLHSLLFLVTYYSDAIKKLLFMSYSVGPGVVVGRTLLNPPKKGFIIISSDAKFILKYNLKNVETIIVKHYP